MLCIRHTALCLLAFSFAATSFGQVGWQTTPVPSDPLELATGSIQTVSTPEDRAAVIKLLNRARDNYQLRQARTGYDVKISFTANSGGVTQYDGNWQLEEMFVPQFGVRWTAKTANYATTQMRAQSLSYGDAPQNSYPLVLHEARGALFGPMPAISNTERDVIRTAAATLNGVSLTCVLLSGPGNAANVMTGRNWNETEECIDPQSGVLVTHSLAPGRYAVYDYSNTPQFHGHLFPKKVTITEGGSAVIEVRVDSLEDLPTADASLFVPTDQMKANGPATEEAGALKMQMFSARQRMATGSNIMFQPVVVFGLLTPSGEIVEAHSLQASDPNSAAAVGAVKGMHWPVQTAPGATPQEHFVFVTEQFVSSAQ